MFNLAYSDLCGTWYLEITDFVVRENLFAKREKFKISLKSKEWESIVIKSQKMDIRKETKINDCKCININL